MRFYLTARTLRELVFGAAACVLLMIATGHLVPSAWSQSREQNIPMWVVPVTVLVAFAAAVLVGPLTAPNEGAVSG